MPLTYLSGEEIRAGDRILYHGEPGTVEFVAMREEDAPLLDPATEWNIEQFGSGCMVNARNFGCVFVDEPKEDDDLEFVARHGALE
jgi:hypothetical protein